jgi:hypothetical protein
MAESKTVVASATTFTICPASEIRRLVNERKRLYQTDSDAARLKFRELLIEAVQAAREEMKTMITTRAEVKFRESFPYCHEAELTNVHNVLNKEGYDIRYCSGPVPLITLELK